METKQYPIIDGHRKHYVRVPVQVTEEIAKKFPYPIEVGKFIAVDVLKKGYQYLIAPNPLLEKECQKACDVHNSYHGWTPEEVDEIIKISMDIN